MLKAGFFKNLYKKEAVRSAAKNAKFLEEERETKGLFCGLPSDWDAYTPGTEKGLWEKPFRKQVIKSSY